ncbi:MAG: hypothetical protein H0V51_05835 [Chloroflexi bacterium]|nr:hypothetical protein [Chloroflexota bacterium]
MTSSPDVPRQPSAGDAPEGYAEYEDPAVVSAAPAVEPLQAILDDPVAFERTADDLKRRRSSFPEGGRPVASLLDAVIWFFKLRAETTLVEADATASRPMDQVLEEEQRLADEALDRAREDLPAFETGLRKARAAGGREVTFDSRDPDQDRMAGALIGYLVATDFATARTEDLPGDQYRYHIAVDLPRLDAFARRLGIATP